jgi:hypothetical protein
MAHALLWSPELPACLDCFAAVVKNVVKELEVLACKLIAPLFGLTVRERCLAAETFLHVSTTPLNHMRKQPLPLRFPLQIGVEKTE